MLGIEYIKRYLSHFSFYGKLYSLGQAFQMMLQAKRFQRIIVTLWLWPDSAQRPLLCNDITKEQFIAECVTASRIGASHSTIESDKWCCNTSRLHER